MLKIPFNKNNDGTDQLAALATWTAGHEYRNKKEQLELASRQVQKIIDPVTYKLIVDRYFSDDYGSTEDGKINEVLDSAVVYLQKALVHFAYCKSVDIDSVQWSDTGIQVKYNEDSRPAQADKLLNLAENIENNGYEWLDVLIDLLNSYPDVFINWKNSPQNLILKGIYINDANDFNLYFNINNSTSRFFSMFDIIRRVQRNEILSAIGCENDAKVLAYQLNRQECESSKTTVATVDDLANLDHDTIKTALVSSEKAYYSYSGSAWALLCYDVRDILELIKPGLVDLTMYYHYNASHASMRDKDKVRIERLQMLTESLKASGMASVEKLRLYLFPPVELTEVVDYCDPYSFNVGNNSIMV